MAVRILPTTARALSRTSASAPQCLRSTQQARSFSSTGRMMDAVVAPVKKPVGAFRGGITGFFLGATLAGAGMYYYVLEEYKVSNEMLTTDIFSLQAAVQRLEGYTRKLEEKVDAVAKK
ncbi:hypothetical protein K402DRAFT_33096 [Aulographum hederae CBS 113979]|uniref:Uncharacterized protein n=1 Tax=Aulographum hederae CBS 113979 TaxID=1176131 RepID=A0A6G1H529_9PEZI|nr:hypothetical protein K402DRAFT_33096 [Aulographum hederae CBS 113979]